MLGGVAAAAASKVEEAGFGEVGEMVRHVTGLEVKAGRGEGVGEAGVGIATEGGGGTLVEVLEEGLHEVGPQGAVESDREGVGVGDGVPEGFPFLGGNHGFASPSDGGTDDDGELVPGFVEDFLTGNEGRFGVEGIEDGFHHEDVDAPFDEGFDLVGVGIFHLIEGDGAEGGVVGVGEIGEGDRHGADGSGYVAGAAGVVGNAIGFDAAEFGRLDIEPPDEVLQKGVVNDFFLEKLRVFAGAVACFAGVFDEELGLREGGAGEGVGFDDVTPSLVEALVDVGDDIGAGEGENVAVIKEVFLVLLELVAASVAFTEFVTTNGGSHGAVENENAFAQGFSKIGCGVRLHDSLGAQSV